MVPLIQFPTFIKEEAFSFLLKETFMITTSQNKTNKYDSNCDCYNKLHFLILI